MTELEEIVGRSCFRLVEWRDRALETRGVDPRSRYAEQFWLPVLGPSTMWLLRHFAWWLERLPSGTDLVLADTARSVGLGERVGRHAPLFRTLGRAIDFGMIRVEASDTISSRRRLPLVSARQLSRLPDPLRLCHEHWVRGAPLSQPPPARATERPAVAVTSQK